MIVNNNSPQAGFISWSGVSISYKGTVYNIADGNTDFIYIYWKFADPLTFYGSNTFPTLGSDDLLVFLNKNGIHVKVPNTTIIDGSLIVPESILANAISANAITAEKLAAGAVTATSIAAGAIGTNALAAGAVVSDKIAAGAITANTVAANAIGTNAIAAGAITADSGILATAAVGTAAIANLAVTNAKIANLAVGTAQIADTAITNAKIANLAVDATKIADATITNAKIANVDAAKITTGTLAAARIGADTITADKINVTSLSALSANLGTVTAGTINGVQINGSTFYSEDAASTYAEKPYIRITGGLFEGWHKTNATNSEGVKTTFDRAQFKMESLNSVGSIVWHSIVAPAGFYLTDNIDATTLSMNSIINGLESNSMITLQSPSAKVTTRMGIGVDPHSSYALNVSGDIMNTGWIRTMSTSGLYFQSYGGGWHMSDTTWIRAYDGKSVYTAGDFKAGGRLLTDGMTITDNTFQTTSTQFTWNLGNGQYMILSEGAGATIFRGHLTRLVFQDGSSRLRVESWNGGYADLVVGGTVYGSDRAFKKNITKFGKSALDEIERTPIYEYNMLEEIDGLDRKHVGIVMQEAPLEVVDTRGKGVDAYAMQAMSWKAIQELAQRVKALETAAASAV